MKILTLGFGVFCLACAILQDGFEIWRPPLLIYQHDLTFNFVTIFGNISKPSERFLTYSVNPNSE